MCGIIGFVSKNSFSSRDLLNALKKLEYRGYDSAGIAMLNQDFNCVKSLGQISELEKKLDDSKANIGIAHTRWATTGSVTNENAHPHFSCDKSIAIVHNGIIDNYQELKKELEKAGHKFISDTDSEVIAHFFKEELKRKDIKKAVEKFFSTVKGEFAILLARKGDDKIYAMKRGSPLVLGVGDNENIIASDIYAFSDRTNNAIFFNEDELAIISDGDYEFYKYDTYLKAVEKSLQKLELSGGQENKNGFDHYMIKEIKEEPEAVNRLLQSLKNEQHEKMQEMKKLIQDSRRVVFVAGGTSYHASLLGVDVLNKAGIEAHTIIASEFRNFTLLDENTLIIPITQSGETMDVIEALRGIKACGAKIASIVNVPYSTIQRMSNLSINIMAGQEVCVAATKTYVNQVVTLLYLASLFGYKAELNNLSRDIEKIFEQEEKIKDVAKSLKHKHDIYLIGRDLCYPAAREIALKLKEIAYIHAEGMMAGELKHGTLALIEKGVPVISLMPKGDEHIISNTKEVEARGADIIAISNNNRDYERIEIPSNDFFSILAVIAGQLLTYHIAKEKKLEIDKPRNLAKSVTVK